MPKIKISTAQINVSNSVERNGIEIRKLLKKGKLQGANIVHFCEGELSGYVPKDNRSHNSLYIISEEVKLNSQIRISYL